MAKYGHPPGCTFDFQRWISHSRIGQLSINWSTAYQHTLIITINVTHALIMNYPLLIKTRYLYTRVYTTFGPAKARVLNTLLLMDINCSTSSAKPPLLTSTAHTHTHSLAASLTDHVLLTARIRTHVDYGCLAISLTKLENTFNYIPPALLCCTEHRMGYHDNPHSLINCLYV